VIEEGATGRGWKEHGITAEAYLQELADLDAELQKDDYVLGATVFTAGPNDDWRDFDVDEFADRVEYTDKRPWEEEEAPQQGGGTVATYHLGNLDITDLRETLPTSTTERYLTRFLSDIRRIIIHHSATPVTTTALSMAQYHMSKGWPGIAYHFVITSSGEIQYVNDHTLITYGVGGQNSDTVHICLVGDFTDAPPPEAQLVAAKNLIDNYRLAMGRVYAVYGHKDIAGDTQCPGNTWSSWKARLTDEPVVATDWQVKYNTVLAANKVLTDKLATANAKISAARSALS
jgi:N-acetyl-anhydromuramyl-L-alanine amidase AmpD